MDEGYPSNIRFYQERLIIVPCYGAGQSLQHSPTCILFPSPFHIDPGNVTLKFGQGKYYIFLQDCRGSKINPTSTKMDCTSENRLLELFFFIHFKDININNSASIDKEEIIWYYRQLYIPYKTVKIALTISVPYMYNSEKGSLGGITILFNLCRATQINYLKDYKFICKVLNESISSQLCITKQAICCMNREKSIGRLEHYEVCVALLY